MSWIRWTSAWNVEKGHFEQRVPIHILTLRIFRAYVAIAPKREPKLQIPNQTTKSLTEPPVRGPNFGQKLDPILVPFKQHNCNMIWHYRFLYF